MQFEIPKELGGGGSTLNFQRGKTVKASFEILIPVYTRSKVLQSSSPSIFSKDYQVLQYQT